MFISSEIHISTREDLSHFDDCCKSVTVEIDKCVFDTNRSMIICVLYRPPNTDARLFNGKLIMFFNTVKVKINYALYWGIIISIFSIMMFTLARLILLI